MSTKPMRRPLPLRRLPSPPPLWLLLLLLGVEVGSNAMIMGNLHRLGLDALIIAALATIFSIVASVLLWHRLKSGSPDAGNGNTTSESELCEKEDGR